MYKLTAPMVSTIKEQCRVCYTCVRECPAKAIRIADRQAEVMPERCIGCGNCVRVCSQRAKRVAGDLENVRALLNSGERVAACLAPSFPAEFVDFDYDVLVGLVRAAGFDLVIEVAFGADLVAEEYRRLLARNKGRRYIATNCPAITAFVEKYHPQLVPNLAPIVSPMVATARAVRDLYGQEVKIVFVGPCIAKKGEAAGGPVQEDMDAVLTFIELRQLFAERGLDAGRVQPADFDPPHASSGALFPISRGMLQAAQIDEDLIAGEVVAADGRSEFVEALREFESGDLNVHLLEALCCNGCIMGPGLSCEAPLFRRRARVSRAVRQRIVNLDWSRWREDIARLAGALDLTRTFAADDQRVRAPSLEEVRQILSRLGKLRPEDELNCGACGYETCIEHAVAIFRGLAETEMCLPYSVEQLRRTCEELTMANKQLATTQEALMQSEKLASMGQLAAGIAHEVNNPLGTVLMLSHLLLEEASADSPQRGDLTMIAAEADRCKKIVSGLLHFARRNKVEARQVNLREVVEQAARALPPGGGIDVVHEHNGDDVTAEIDRDQILQVLTNLISNAVAAMPSSGRLTLRTWAQGEDVRFSVGDTGTGIPPENRKKIFEPFFTTKPAGQGTGLGLAVSYGIVKMHHGDIRVESNADPAAGLTGTTFTVTLPRRRRLPGSEADGNGPSTS